MGFTTIVLPDCRCLVENCNSSWRNGTFPQPQGMFPEVQASCKNDSIRMMRRFTTRSLRIPKPPLGLVTAAIVLVIFVAVASPEAAFALRRVDPHHHHRILHAFRFRGLRGMLWNPLFRPRSEEHT